MTIIRSFDINKPGTDFKQLQGGILGGCVKYGSFKISDKIKILPGIKQTKNGKEFYKEISTNIIGIRTDKENVESANYGGNYAILTDLDPVVTKSDSLIGQTIVKQDEKINTNYELNFEANLFKKVLFSKEEIPVTPIIQNEVLMIIINSGATVGIVQKVKKNTITVKLKIPVVTIGDEKIILFRRIKNTSWKNIGYGELKN